MHIAINWLAVVLATVVSMIVAGVWYTNATFGPVWQQLTHIDAERAKKAGNTPMLIVLVVNFITAVVLAVVISIVFVYFDTTSVWLALSTGFALWLAFSATTLLTHNMFEQKSSKLTLINNGYQLALLMSMALVIGLLQ